MAAQKSFQLLLGGVIAFLVFLLVHQRLSERSVEAELARMTGDYAAALRKAKDLEQEVGVLRQKVSAATSKIQQLAPNEDAPFEDALAPWIARTRELQAYLLRHPELQIPQMENLKAEEWLEVTKSRDFATEADFRRALGTLRGLVRARRAPEIGSALKKAIEANGGRVPTTPQELAPYLSPGTDPAILHQFVPNPSGRISGLSSKNEYVLIDKPIDLWDSTLFYSKDGGWGTRSAVAVGEASIRQAIAHYIKANGSPPRTLLDLRDPDLSKLDPEIANEVFSALISKPQ
jgi:hypothetical protein